MNPGKQEEEPASGVELRSSGDASCTVGELKRAVRNFVAERDWERFHAPKNLSMALAAEAGELLEHFLWCGPEASHERARLEAGVAEELADVVLYALQLANVAEIDLSEAIRKKMERNAEKYPVEKARGNSLKYTELE